MVKQKISVILRCRNEERYIGHCLQSLDDFLYEPEIILLNNNSTDNSIRVVNTFDWMNIRKIHINNDDPNWSKGGFKHFSRSISIENLNIYANLDIALDKPRSLEKHIEELKIMDDHQLSKYNLTYRDYDIYNSKQEDNVVSKMTIQTKLFSHDLSLVKNKGYTLYEKLKISFLIVKSIREMHKKGYIHRDIKSKNILLQRVNNNIEVSLADYGLSLHQKNSNFGRHIAGTRGYIAPESCLSKNQSGFAYLNFSSAKKSDIFSLALTLDELFFDNYKLKEFTTEVNNISLPKDKKKPINSLRLKESVASYNREHKKILESIIQVDRGDTKEKQIMYHLKRLIWQMSHPNYEERPTLSHIGKTLVQLKKFCNSDEVELQ